MVPTHEKIVLEVLRGGGEEAGQGRRAQKVTNAPRDLEKSERERAAREVSRTARPANGENFSNCHLLSALNCCFVGS